MSLTEQVANMLFNLLTLIDSQPGQVQHETRSTFVSVETVFNLKKQSSC